MHSVGSPGDSPKDLLMLCGYACGCRFEGFDAALESANADITSGEQELRAASLANLALQRTAPAREQLRYAATAVDSPRTWHSRMLPVEIHRTHVNMEILPTSW